MGRPKLCRECGRDVGRDEHVEIRVLDWEPTRRRGPIGRKSKSLMSMVYCPTCAIEVMDRIYGGAGR